MNEPYTQNLENIKRDSANRRNVQNTSKQTYTLEWITHTHTLQQYTDSDERSTEQTQSIK